MKSDIEVLQGLGYQYLSMGKSHEGLPVLSLLSNKPAESEDGVGYSLEMLAFDFNRFVGERIIPSNLTVFPKAKLGENGELFCEMEFVEEKVEQDKGYVLAAPNFTEFGKEKKFNVGRLQVSRDGTRIDILFLNDAASHFPEVSGYPATRQMKGLLDDYSKPLRVRKPGPDPWL